MTVLASSQLVGIIEAKRMNSSDMKRTTVGFEDIEYEILERWARKDIRTVPKLIAAIVVSNLRGEPLEMPPDIAVMAAEKIPK